MARKKKLPSKNLISVLSLNDLRFKIHLGCSDQERKVPQTVRVDLSIRFKKSPTGCQSDRLEDALCYDELSQTLASPLKGRSFHLVEHVCYLLYTKVKKKAPSDAWVWVKVTKLFPPISFLKGGASFSYGDWLPLG